MYGVSTGFKNIDHVSGGLHPGEVTIIAARTSHGKTALANGIAFNVAEATLAESIETGADPPRVMIFSPEMTAEQLLLRQACSMAAVSSQRIRTGRADEQDRAAFLEAVRTLRNLEDIVELRAGGSIDVDDLVESVDNRTQSHEVRLVVIDYLQRLTITSRGTTYDRASAMSLKIKDLANVYKVPVLMLSQLNRSPEKRKDPNDPESQYPELSDLRDSGRIEEDADSVWLLWRPNKMTAQSAEEDYAQKALLRVAKNRNGPVADIPLRFFPHLTRFADAGDRVEYDGGNAST